jgi:hypothetical protein
MVNYLILEKAGDWQSGDYFWAFEWVMFKRIIYFGWQKEMLFLNLTSINIRQMMIKQRSNANSNR